MSNQILIVLLNLAFVILCIQAASANGCPRGSSLDSSTSQCTLCPPGSYQFTINATSCIPCDPGKYLPYAGAQSAQVCRVCPAGTFSTAGSSSCTPCPEGTSSSEGSSRCKSCPKGTRIMSWWIPGGEETCETCPVGYADEENLLECKSCPPGTAAPPGATSADQCATCPAGTASRGYDRCYDCQPGQFSDTQASAKCSHCPTGWKSEKDFGSTKCIPCEPGQYGRIIGTRLVHAACLECPENTTSYASGRRFCRRIDGPCPRGYIQTSTGDCERCEIDEMYDMEQERCVPCPPNEGSAGGLPLQCAPCAEVIRAEVVKSQCIPWDHMAPVHLSSQICAPGSLVHDTEFARFCSVCSPGYFSSVRNSAECLQCPEGTVSAGLGASRCEHCPEGMIPDISRTQCVDRKTNCPIDTQLVADPHIQGYTYCVSKECSVAEDGSYSCPPCTDSYSLEGCEPCPGNQVRSHDLDCGCRGPLAQNLGMINGICSECPPGSYGKLASDGDYHECVMCPAGTRRVVATYERMLCSMSPRCGESEPCEKCAPGFVTRHDGATVCEQCPPGTFTYGIGEKECLSFGAPSGAVHFNHPLDLNVYRELESISEWWDAWE